LNDLLSGLISKYEVEALKNNTKFAFNKGLKDDECEIYTDEIKLQQALIKIFDNAVKFTHNGNIDVGYQIKNGFIHMYIKDTGIGIDPDKIDMVFESFTHENETITSQYGGLGLGLSICKKNIELLGGNVSVKSKKGVGSNFRIAIPYIPTERISNSNIKHLDIKGQKNFTILVVDDSEINHLYLETLFFEEYNLNCELIQAWNGKEAVEICTSNPKIDIVLMDIKMQVMDGFIATKLIKNLRPQLPIIAQTAYSTYEDIAKSKFSGFDDFISKPLNEEKLFPIINKYMNLGKT
jgi:CheY-like chemotaxis protein/anti-sigma regulatory factor (Ser/Thr protein kinase)